MHKYNMNSDFIIWLSKLEDLGLTYVNIHLLEDDDAKDIKVSQETQIEFLGMLYEVRFKRLKIGNFVDMRTRLFTGAGGDCVWNSCDPYTTDAVQGIGPQGELHNCGRTNKEGVDFIKADAHYPMRDMVLQSTPQESGGCQGCRYWHACRGYCPGTAMDSDWRNRTEHCESLKAIFGWIEKEKWQVDVKEKK